MPMSESVEPINRHGNKDKIVVFLEAGLGRLVRRDAKDNYRALSAQVEMILAKHYESELSDSA